MTTKIEWVINPDGIQGMSWNPVVGCTVASIGCLNCYAERIFKRFHSDKDFSELSFHYNRLSLPLHVKKPTTFFVCSMSDLFNEHVPFVFIDKVFSVIEQSPQHTFLILTKRVEKMNIYLKYHSSIPQNAWYGISVENEFYFWRRYGFLKRIDGKIFVSFEPLLEETAMRLTMKDRLPDWVIIGAESGDKRRNCNISWIEKMIDECYYLDIPVFVKQIHIGGMLVRDVSQFPEGMQLREIPYLVKKG